MIVKNDRVIAEANHGARSPISIYHGEHLVFSKYVVLGTTYNSQSWTVTDSLSSSGKTWQLEIIAYAGTDAGGDYYYFGLPNDTQGVAYEALYAVVSNIFSSAHSATNRLRTIERCIYFGTQGGRCLYAISDSNFTSYRLTDSADVNTTISGIFQNATSLQEVIGGAAYINRNIIQPIKSIAYVLNNTPHIVTLGGGFLQGMRFAENCDVRFAYINTYMLEDSLNIDTWVAADGISKPTLQCEGAFLLNYQRDVPAAKKSTLNVAGIRFRIGPQQVGVSFGSVKCNIINISDIKILPRSGDTDAIQSFSGFVANSLTDSTLTFSRMTEQGVKLVANNTWQICSNNTNLTYIDMTALYAPDTPTAARLYNGQMFSGCTNIVSLKILAHTINAYCVAAAAGEEQDIVQSVDFSPLIAWNDATEIESFIQSLASDTCRQYSAYAKMVSIQFNATQSATVRALANWATLSTQIAANGWNVQLL